MKNACSTAILLLILKLAGAAVSFTFTSPLCGTLTGNYTNTSTGTNVAYLWYFNDPASGVNNFAINATKTTQSHTFTALGTYNVKLYILDITNNPIDSVMHTIQVVAAPNLFIFPSSFKNYCIGDSENNFINATLDPAYKYTWNPTPLSTNATGNSVEYRFTHTQTFTVLVTDTTTGCTNTKSITVSFINCAPITSQFTFTAPLCGVMGVSFKNTSLSAHHYKWYFGDPTSGTNDTLSKTDTSSVFHNFTDTGSFYVSLVVFDSIESKKDSSVKLVRIYRQSLANIQTNDTTLCIGSNLSLTGFGLGTAVWSPAAFLSTTTGFTTIASPPVTTTFYLTTNNNGCIATDSVIITIKAKPDPDFKTDTLCIKQPYTFIANNSTFSYYVWSFGTNDTAVGLSASHTFDTAGVYKIKLYVFDGVCDSFVIKDVLVIKDPIADFAPDKTKAEITKATFQFINKCYNATRYHWDFGDFTSSTVPAPIHTYTDTGWFQVVLTAFNSLGCDDTASFKIRVDNLYKYEIPNAFSPNGTGPIENDYFKVVGPAGITKYEMTIYNRWGERVFFTADENLPWDGLAPDGKECPTGNYLYVVKFKDPTGKRLIFNGIVSLIR